MKKIRTKPNSACAQLTATNPNPSVQKQIQFGEGLAKYIDLRLGKDREFNRWGAYKKFKFRALSDFQQIQDSLAFVEIKASRLDELSQLDDEIKKGRINALRELVMLAQESTRRLTEWANKEPEFVKIVAADYPSWPLLCTLSASQNKSMLDLLRRIALDSLRPLSANAVDIGVNPGPARKCAKDLLRHLDATRSALLNDFRRDPHNMVQVVDSSESLRIDRKYPELANEVKSLPPFSKESVSKWWTVADKLLRLMNNNRIWENPDLASYAATHRVVKVYEELKADGVKNGEILKSVEQGFEHLVPHEKAKKKSKTKKRTK